MKDTTKLSVERIGMNHERERRMFRIGEKLVRQVNREQRTKGVEGAEDSSRAQPQRKARADKAGARP